MSWKKTSTLKNVVDGVEPLADEEVAEFEGKWDSKDLAEEKGAGAPIENEKVEDEEQMPGLEKAEENQAVNPGSKELEEKPGKESTELHLLGQDEKKKEEVANPGHLENFKGFEGEGKIEGLDDGKDEEDD